MWTRKELKERAKEALKRNYWKVVLVSFLIILLGGGINSPTAAWKSATSTQDRYENNAEDGNTVIILENKADIAPSSESKAWIYEIVDTVDEALEDTVVQLQQVNIAVWIVLTVVFMIVFLIVFVIIIFIDIFLVNPLLVGTQRFMLMSVDGTGNVAELGYTFDHNYGNGVKTTFFRDLHIILWSFLFIIPGIYKKYQYYMVDYILAEHPDMPPKEVLECSKRMMDGEKWNAFVLDLSFILWHMLSLLTCGILEIFYVRPYVELTRASLYRTLCGRDFYSAGQNGMSQQLIIEKE